MKQYINEAKRMQQLAGVITEAEMSDSDLKTILITNNKEELYNSVINIPASEALSVALGMEIISNNFNCEPNGAVIDNVIDYLKQKSK